jgi:AraC-like DNA-binding protein
VERACKDISNAVLCGRRLKFQQLASDMKLSPGHLHRSFKKFTGLTPLQYTKFIQQQNEAKPFHAEDQAEILPVIAVSENEDCLPCDLDFDNASMYEHIDWGLIDWNAFDSMMESDFNPEGCDTVQTRESDCTKTIACPS